MQGLSLKNINKRVGGEIHLSDINLTFQPGTKNVLLGRTLAGKTSLLRIIAGLDRPTSGLVEINGRDVTRTSVRKRSVAMVYQQFINYPSLTIYDNIASPLKLSGMNRLDINRKVRQVAKLLHIDGLLERLPSELSGGQQQRTAIARALVKDAELLLLDEPLVNLDYKLREELRVELQTIFQEREAIVVYTTTEPSEALMLGGNIVVVDEGRILQTGSTPAVYQSPASIKVAEVFSDPPINFLPGSVTEKRISLSRGISVDCRGHLAALQDGSYLFGIRSNHLFLEERSPADISLGARVELSEINGSETFIHLSFAGQSVVAQEEGILPRKIGSDITVFFHPSSLFVYEPEGKLVAAPHGATRNG